MKNHYHLALETPEGNLVAGMQWVQATFANRFNRRRGERGHLFQGRDKSLLVEPGAALGQTRDEIRSTRKSEARKVALAAKLKPITQADNRWLAEQLHLGNPVAVSHHTGQLRRGQRPAAEKCWKKLRVLTVKPDPFGLPRWRLFWQGAATWRAGTRASSRHRISRRRRRHHVQVERLRRSFAGL
ncbi:MAG: hypothetical protein FJ399_06880 [Verrucomicrobia bacterium]|nr:hypothetical protein [Verrucomicrobiota bacterium]